MCSSFLSASSWRWLGVLLGGATTAVFLWFLPSLLPTVWHPIIGVDTAQSRINLAAPVPQGQFSLEQIFVPRRNGLAEIEVTAVAYNGTGGENGRFSLQLYDHASTLIAEQTWDAQTLQHNQKLQLRFPPQSQSAQQPYQLQISGNNTSNISVWGYSLDVYGGGELTLQPTPLAAASLPNNPIGDIQFVARYQLGWADTVATLTETLFYEGGLLLVALLFLPLPGCLLLLARPKTGQLDDVAAWWGVALAVGIAVWGILWFWLTLLGGRWWGWLLWLLLLAGWGGVVWLWRRQPPNDRQTITAAHGWLLLLLLLGFAVRLLAVRDINFPPWVDSSRHALITAMAVENGRFPSDYTPFLPVNRFPYHFGFHALAASLKLLIGWPLPRLLLFLGQLLNGLVPLTIYAAAWLLWRRRSAALLAAFVVALPFFFPGYYATWGRLTQLTAVLLFPPLLAVTWNLLAKPGNGRQTWWLVGLLAAGLFFVHLRVFLFYLPFAAVALFVHLPKVWQNGRWLLAAVALGSGLSAPRIFQLARVTNPTATISYTLPNYNAFPTSYLTVGWEPYFLWAAAIGLLIIIGAALWRPHFPDNRWTTLPITLAAWVACLFLLLAGEQIGLPETTLVNLNSLYITLFVPLALFLGGGFGELWHWLEPRHWLWSQAVGMVVGAGVLLGTLFGIQQQVTILNPQTILVQPVDLQGIDWVANNLPADTHIAVNSWRWLGDTWAGSDGGAWLLPLTGRSTTTPPADYIYDQALRQQVIDFNETATAVTDWANPAQAVWLAQQGVTHIFVGARGGFFDPAALAQNPQLDLVYSQDGVFVFRIKVKNQEE